MLRRLHERAQQVGFRDDAHEVAVVDDRQGADPMIEHEHGGVSGIPSGADRHQCLRHHRFDGEPREQIVDLPDGQARGRRRQVEPDVAVGDHARELWPVGDQQVTDPLAEHDLPRLEHRRVQIDRDGLCGHEIADLHVERFHFLPLPLTVRTGQVAATTTRPATLPRNSFASPERPWVPMTMTSTRFDLANRMICSCATPSSRVPEARTPAPFARASSFAICRWAHDRFDAAISSYTFGEMYPSPATGTTGLITCAISSWPRLVLASSMAFRSAAFEAVEKSDG